MHKNQLFIKMKIVESDRLLASFQEQIQINRENLRLRNSHFSLGNYYLIYEQIQDGIPVFDSRVGVKVSREGQIKKLNVRLYKNIPELFSIGISENYAHAVAKNNFQENSKEKIEVTHSSQIIIPLNNNEEYTLCWKIILSSPQQGKEAFFINTYNGALVFTKKLVRKAINGNVAGYIFEENYYDTWANHIREPAIDTYFNHQTVTNINTSSSTNTIWNGNWTINNGSTGNMITSTLSGPFIDISSASATTVDEHNSSTIYTWVWNDTTTHVDEYNVFFHGNLIHDYFLNYFGYQWENASGDTTINATVYYNSQHAFGGSGIMLFGILPLDGETEQPYWARTSDLIYHEYTHSVLDDIEADDYGYMDEGFADYFACTIVGESHWGEGGYVGRDINNSRKYPDDWITNAIYHNGDMVAAGAWDLRTALGAEKADSLIFGGLCNLGISAHDKDFRNFIGCILEADDDFLGDSDPNNGTPNQADILDAFGNHNMYPSHYVYSGELDTNDPQILTWVDDITITGDVTVTTGFTLEIDAGVTVSFTNSDDQSGGSNTSKSEIIVNGTLQADGATFTASSIGDWYGIIYNSTASDTSFLDNCTIENAYRAVEILNSDPLVEECDISNCQYGIYVNGSSANPTVTKCEIDNITYYALLDYNGADGDYYDNKLSATRDPIRIYNGDSHFWVNDILQSTDYNGVIIYGSSTCANLGSESGVLKNGNYFDSDVDDDIVHISAGTPNFGYYSEAYNHFEGVGGSGYYIDNNTGSTINAHDCYWDDGTQPSVSEFDGSVSTTSWESTPPNAGTTWKKIPDEGNGPNPFADGLESYHARNYAAAATEIKNAFEMNSFHEMAYFALARYFSACTKTDAFPVDFCYKVFTGDYNPSVVQVARTWLIRYYSLNHQMQKAEQVAFTAPESSDFERVVLLDLIYYYSINDESQSVERVVKLLKQGHNDNDLDADISAAIQVGNEIRQSIDQSEHQQTTTISGLESTGVQSYPNPFNASTAILYNLKSASYVTIKIYDILGRLVKVLADSWQKPGQHGLVWNGRNDNENFVASGVYLVTIKTDQITKTLKVAYVK